MNAELKFELSLTSLVENQNNQTQNTSYIHLVYLHTSCIQTFIQNIPTYHTYRNHHTYRTAFTVFTELYHCQRS
jgi:hypothetical protein